MICGILGLVAAIWLWLLFATRFHERTVKDVYPFLRLIENDILVGTFSPIAEQTFRADHTAKEFRAWQWKRIHLAIHLCRDISANCLVLLGWVQYERKRSWGSFPDELKKAVRHFRIACMHSSTAAFSVRVRLRLWLIRMMLFPMLPVPSFSSLERHSDSLAMFYGTAETLAEVVSLAYGDEVHQSMVDVLGMLELDESENGA